tara:strand:- start:110 stop:406 length:297 start_codon:yes stop_codon:yes gene_type:complete
VDSVGDLESKEAELFGTGEKERKNSKDNSPPGISPQQNTKNMLNAQFSEFFADDHELCAEWLRSGQEAVQAMLKPMKQALGKRDRVSKNTLLEAVVCH